MPRSGTPFGPLDFQLVLLRRMADHQPGLVEDARRELGVTLAEMREANRRWQAMVRSPRSRGAAQRYRSVLGVPSATARRKIGDLECDALQWPVPLWPGLRFEVLTGPGGAVWNEWLVRAPGAVAGPAHGGRPAALVVHGGRGGPRLRPRPPDGGHRADPVAARPHTARRAPRRRRVHLGAAPGRTTRRHTAPVACFPAGRGRTTRAAQSSARTGCGRRTMR